MAETVIVQPGEVGPAVDTHALADTACFLSPKRATYEVTGFKGGGSQGMVFSLKDNEKDLVIKLYPVEMGRFLDELTEIIINADNSQMREAYYLCRTPEELNQLNHSLTQQGFDLEEFIRTQSASFLPNMARNFYSNKSLSNTITDWESYSDLEQLRQRVRSLVEKKCAPTQVEYENQITDLCEVRSRRYRSVIAIDPDTWEVTTAIQSTGEADSDDTAEGDHEDVIVKTAVRSSRITALYTALAPGNNEIGKFYGTIYEAVEGVTLDEYQPQSLAEALVIMNRIAHSTEADFEAGLYNLDIKPDNIIVNGHDPVIVDRALTLKEGEDGTIESPVPYDSYIFNRTTLMPDCYQPIIREPFHEMTAARLRKDIVLTTLAFLGVETREVTMNRLNMLDVEIYTYKEIIDQLNSNSLFKEYDDKIIEQIAFRIREYLEYYIALSSNTLSEWQKQDAYENATDLLHHLFTEPLGIDKLQSLEMD